MWRVQERIRLFIFSKTACWDGTPWSAGKEWRITLSAQNWQDFNGVFLLLINTCQKPGKSMTNYLIKPWHSSFCQGIIRVLGEAKMIFSFASRGRIRLDTTGSKHFICYFAGWMDFIHVTYPFLLNPRLFPSSFRLQNREKHYNSTKTPPRKELRGNHL